VRFQADLADSVLAKDAAVRAAAATK
jgi:hypothetical protein